MSSQAFRSQLPSNVVVLPTRYDPKSDQRVIRWKDIQQCFKDVQYVTNDGQVVMFLTDDNLEDLIPLRIAHHSGVVLGVVLADDSQGGSGSVDVLSHHHGHVPGESSIVIPSSNEEVVSLTRNVASLRIREADETQALIMHPQGYPSERTVQRLAIMSVSRQQPAATEENVHLQEQLRQLQQQIQQMEEILRGIRQTDRQAQSAHQQTREDVETTLQQTQDSMQQLGQHFEECQRTVQQSDVHRQQHEETLQTSQKQLQQQQIEEMQLKMQQLDQKTQGLHQQTQRSQQQVQKQFEEAAKKIQQIYQHVQHSQQQHERLQQQIREMGKLSQQQQECLLLEAFDKFVHVQHRVQAALAKPFLEPPPPRLFIILPEPTGAQDAQGRPLPLHFRLYFLCECGAHTMTKNCNRLHEVHLANHPGYDLDDQNKFIDKYGSYLLTMMYMVKYGARVGGLVVPPLLNLHQGIEDGANQERLQFIKQNIGRLVSDTITYLESAINTVNIKANTTALMDLGSSELAQLKSYLKVADDEDSIGDLWAISTQEGHRAWICRVHLFEYNETYFQQFKVILFAAGGVCHNSKVQLVITPETTKKLYDAVGKICKVQNTEILQLLTKVSLDLGSHSSAMKSTLEIISSLNDLESLTLDFGRVSMIMTVTSQGLVDNVSLEIPRLSVLTPDDFNFIYQCHQVSLKILHASETKDEARIVNIIERITDLRELHIGCVGGRSFILVNSILSKREKVLQSGGQFTLRTLEVKGEGLVPLQEQDDYCRCYQYLGGVTVSFLEGLHSSDMETHVNFHSSQLASNNTAVLSFLRQYGWSIKTLGAPRTFTDHHAELLNLATREQGSMMERADINPFYLSEIGLNVLDRVINRSKNFLSVRLQMTGLQRKHGMKKALLLLGRYKSKLKYLSLTGCSEDRQWMKDLAQDLPAKDDFPLLEALCARNITPNASTFVIDRKFCGKSSDRMDDTGLLQQGANVFNAPKAS